MQIYVLICVLISMKKGHQLNDVPSSLNQQSTQPKNQAYLLSSPCRTLLIPTLTSVAFTARCR